MIPLIIPNTYIIKPNHLCLIKQSVTLHSTYPVVMLRNASSSDLLVPFYDLLHSVTIYIYGKPMSYTYFLPKKLYLTI